MNDFKPYPYSASDNAERINKIISASIDANQRISALKMILGAIDLTTLEATDTDARVRALCDQAGSFSDRKSNAHNVAAVCVYPPFAGLVKESLRGTGIKTACVATGFPSGQATLPIKLMEVSSVVLDGAEEVDMVISRGKFLEGKYDEVTNEIRSVKATCGDAHLKVILETGELESIENIRKASVIALLAGADFLKTSTGKVQPAATLEAFLIMIDTIREYHVMTGKMVGIKAAGGIADPETALKYHALTASILGDEWLNKHYFRIGASRLAEKIFSEL
ncbi:MAG: deoxyribose-phosphate aldolase [Bacteroidetes bacterium]|nr:MAG: deoxyribose-phosphate aldolase [Bacteroidota bacterium]